MTLTELMAQRAELDRQIKAEKNARLADCVSRALAVFTEDGFTQGEAADLLIARFNRNLRKAKKPVAKTVAAKYRQVSGSATWTGRGVKPQWFKDGDYAAV